MRRTPLVLFTSVVALLAVGVGTAQGAPRAVHMRSVLTFNDSFVDEDLTAVCGFTVTVTFTGHEDVTLIYNDAGRVVKEIDTTPGGTLTTSSAYGSFTFPLSGRAIFDYPGGATLGSTGTFTQAGMFGRVTSLLPPDAGLTIFTNVVVVDFSPEGIPIVQFTDETAVIEHGPRASGEEIDAAMCAALAPA